MKHQRNLLCTTVSPATRALLTVALGLICALSPCPVKADEGKATVQGLVDIFVHWTGSTADKDSYAKAAGHIDYKLMSERVLGQKRWDSLSNQERSDFIAAFRSLIEKRYYPRWRRIFSRSAITYLSEQSSSRDILVKTRVKTGDSTEEITWTVSKEGGADKVISLTVGERDLIQRAKARFDKKLAKSDFKEFLDWIKKESQRATSKGVDETEDASKS